MFHKSIAWWYKEALWCMSLPYLGEGTWKTSYWMGSTSKFSHMILASLTFRISCSWAAKYTELNTNIKPINASNKFFNLLKLFFNVAISKRFGNFGIPELKPSTPLFSYQYLSPSFRSLNCCPMMQENKGPTLAPSGGISAIPPAYTSISSTSLQVNVSMFSRFLWKSLLKV